MIPYSRQQIDEDDIAAVVDVLRSDYLTQGSVVPKFEQAICNYTGARFGVAVNSGTSALHIACLALGLGQGDWLWTSPISFVASANCGLYCGAQVDFVDISLSDGNLSVVELEEKLIQAEKEGKLPKILVAVHMAGLPCDLKEIKSLSNKYSFKIIEDASHALGARYFDEPIGNCHYSDITVFSFHAIKNITTAEGGMALTNSSELTETMRLLRSHGVTRDPEHMTISSEGPWYYQQRLLGFNYRMTDIQAALGLSQLSKLDSYIHKRNNLALSYDKYLSDLPLQLSFREQEKYSAYHLYVIRYAFLDSTHKANIFNALKKEGIGVNVHYIPIHLQPYYQNLGFCEGDFPSAEMHYEQSMSIPLFPALSEEQQNQIVKIISSLLN